MYHQASDQRAAALREWLQRGLGLELHQLEPASGDASFRRYFRVFHRSGVDIAMDAPPERERTEPFVRLARHFAAAGVRTPKVYHHDAQQGFILLEDFGPHCLLQRLTPQNAAHYYQKALDELIKLQCGVDSARCGLPPYDEALLRRELDIFHEWLLEKRLKLTLPEPLRARVHRVLVRSALEQPRVCVHRDYHTRNLMVTADDDLGVIDFQDAVAGPIVYDVVSLLRDCYIQWPKAQVDAWLDNWRRQIAAALPITLEPRQTQRWFDLMGMQRHLKAAGIFSRLDLRDGKPGYLADIPRTLNYVLQVAAGYPELHDFHHWLSTHLPQTYLNHR